MAGEVLVVAVGMRDAKAGMATGAENSAGDRKARKEKGGESERMWRTDVVRIVLGNYK